MWKRMKLVVSYRIVSYPKTNIAPLPEYLFRGALSTRPRGKDNVFKERETKEEKPVINLNLSEGEGHSK